ncbi:hypothetical protein U0070_021233 [Myodes glareolus]|uniref:Uncharacterized protein n=1 Tax=Myodes glareolus TaxID=447135 RepID=A0AAW0HLV2_MYOGA
MNGQNENAIKEHPETPRREPAKIQSKELSLGENQDTDVRSRPVGGILVPQRQGAPEESRRRPAPSPTGNTPEAASYGPAHPRKSAPSE